MIKNPFRRSTKKVAVAPPPANGAPNGRTPTGEYDAAVEVEEARAEAALARLRSACDAAVSAVRERRASGGHVQVKR